MEYSKKLAILASFIHLCGYAVYNTAALAGTSEPNLVPWAIWGLMAVLNTETYRTQTRDNVKAMLSLAGSAASVVTFGVAWVMGGTFSELNSVNMLALAIGIIAVGVWKLGSAKYANWCVLIAVAAGFVPFYKVLWMNPSAESPFAWSLWSLSTTLNVVVVAIRQHKRSDFAMPVVMMLLHVATLGLIARAF